MTFPLAGSTRREFVGRTLAAGLAVVAGGALGSSRLSAIEPIQRSGGPRFKVSLVGYSFEKYFHHKPSQKLSLFDLIDFAADHGFAGIELTGYYLETPTTPEYLYRLKRHAYLRGVAVSGTSVGNHFALGNSPANLAELKAQIALVKAGVDHAVALGAPYLRVFAGKGSAMALPGVFENCVAGFEECAAYSGEKGVFIAIENDSGLTPDTTLKLLQAVKNPWFALNLDLGNFHTPDVYADCARCAPYAVNVHFKKQIGETGKPVVETDIPRMLSILRAANYQGYLAMEYEAGGDAFVDLPPWKEKLDRALTG